LRFAAGWEMVGPGESGKIMKYKGIITVLALAGASPVALAGTAPSDPLAAKFGARETIRDISISPSGRTVAVVGPAPSGGEGVLVVPVDGNGRMTAIPGSKGGDERLYRCNWTTDTRLVCTIGYIVKEYGFLNGYSRQFAMNSDGSHIKLLSPAMSTRAYYEVGSGGAIIDLTSPDGGNTVLMTRDTATEMSTGTLISSKREGRGVVAIDTVTGKFRQVEAPNPTALGFISDGQGHVRIKAIQSVDGQGYAGSRQTYLYRPLGDGNWRPLSASTSDGLGLSEGFVPVAVDPAQNAVYGFDNHNGFSALYRRKLEDGAAAELVASHNGVDVDALIEIGRQRRVVGVSYATEKRMVEFFDPELSNLAKTLARAFPAGSQISFVDASEDECKLVILNSSDTNPGVFYLYDKVSRKLREIGPVRPELVGMTLAQVKPVTYAAADGTTIPGYLTLPPGSDGKNLPAIVMPHGGPSARDEWGFDWLSQFFAAQGFAVLQPNYRGSAGYGADWYQKNGFQSWRTAIGDINDAGRWLTAQGIAAPGKVAIFGWSYGGYAALQSAVLDPELFKAIVAVAPVTDLDKLREESEYTSGHQLVDKFIGNGPNVAAGSPARHADDFKAPVLLFHGDLDQNVGVEQSRLMAQRLKSAGKKVDYVEYKSLDHYLESSEARTDMLSRSAAFLKAALGI